MYDELIVKPVFLCWPNLDLSMCVAKVAFSDSGWSRENCIVISIFYNWIAGVGKCRWADSITQNYDYLNNLRLKRGEFLLILFWSIKQSCNDAPFVQDSIKVAKLDSEDVKWLNVYDNRKCMVLIYELEDALKKSYAGTMSLRMVKFDGNLGWEMFCLDKIQLSDDTVFVNGKTANGLKYRVN